MQEITIQDPFGQALAKYSEGLSLGVEIGGGTGDGSTQCIRTRELFSLEIHPGRIGRRKYNLDSRQGGIAVNWLSSNPMLWMSVKDVEDFYRTTQTKLNQYPLKQIVEWHKEEFRVAAQYTWGHLSLKDEIDFLLLDGGVFKFGKSRPDKTKYVLVDIEYDEKAGKELFEIGMELLAKDKEAVIEYVIKKALKYAAEFEKAKCKK